MRCVVHEESPPLNWWARLVPGTWEIAVVGWHTPVLWLVLFLYRRTLWRVVSTGAAPAPRRFFVSTQPPLRCSCTFIALRDMLRVYPADPTPAPWWLQLLVKTYHTTMFPPLWPLIKPLRFTWIRGLVGGEHTK